MQRGKGVFEAIMTIMMKEGKEKLWSSALCCLASMSMVDGCVIDAYKTKMLVEMDQAEMVRI